MTSAVRRSQRGGDSISLANGERLPYDGMSVEIEWSVTIERDVDEFAYLRIARKQNTPIDSGRLALRASKPYVASAQVRCERIALAETSPLFDQHAHRTTDSLAVRTLGRSALCVAQ